MIDEAGGEERATATQRTGAVRGLREVDAVAAGEEHAQRRLEIFPLVSTVEGIGQQYDLVPAGGAEDRAFGRKYIAPPRRQRARLALMPATRSSRARSSLLRLRQLASGASRENSGA